MASMHDILKTELQPYSLGPSELTTVRLLKGLLSGQLSEQTLIPFEIAFSIAVKYSTNSATLFIYRIDLDTCLNAVETAGVLFKTLGAILTLACFPTTPLRSANVLVFFISDTPNAPFFVSLE